MKTFLARSAWATEEGLRLDAATYASGGLEVRDRLCARPWSWRRLDALSNVFVESRFARVYVRDAEHGTPYITSSDMLLADLKGLLFLSNARTPQMSKLLIREGWTLISCSGTIGRTVYVRAEMDGLAASHDVIRCLPHTAEISPGYLFAFLSSPQAQAMIRQKTYGNVIQHIEPEHIADMPVPIPDEAFQQRIHELVTRAAEARTEASRLLDTASGYFDALAGPMPSTHDHAYKTGLVSRSDLNFRLDAFHHVGWASEATGFEGPSLAEFATVTRPGTVKRIFVARGIPFVSGIDVYQTRVSSRQRIMTVEVQKANSTVRTGQILVQRSGQRYGLLGRPAYVSSRMEGWAASEDLMVISLSKASDSARVFAFLRSDVGHRLLLRTSYGTSIPKLNPDGLGRLRIPTLPEQLLEGAERAIRLREQADTDEEQAIREVEAWVN